MKPFDSLRSEQSREPFWNKRTLVAAGALLIAVVGTVLTSNESSDSPKPPEHHNTPTVTPSPSETPVIIDDGGLLNERTPSPDK